MSQSKGRVDTLVFLDHLSKMLAQNAGKDKVAKILQYGGKLVASYAIQFNPNSELAVTARRVETSSGAARKVFRLGNELSELQKIRASLNAANPLQTINIISIIRGLGMFSYWVFDHIVWLGSINAMKVDVAKHSYNSSVAWFIGLLSTIIIDFNSFLSLLRKEKQIKSTFWRGRDGEEEDNNSSSAYTQQLKEIQADKNVLYLNFVKNTADLAIAGNLLKIKTLSAKRVGLFGLISAIIGAYQLFPALPH